MKDKFNKQIKEWDYIFYEGDEETPKGEYLIEEKWGRLMMFDIIGRDYELKSGYIVDNCNNRNARRILQERKILTDELNFSEIKRKI